MGNLQSPRKTRCGNAGPSNVKHESSSAEQVKHKFEDSRAILEEDPLSSTPVVAVDAKTAIPASSSNVVPKIPSSELPVAPDEATVMGQVIKVFGMLESKSTPPASALARLQELRDRHPQVFPEVIGQCVDIVISCIGPHFDTGTLDSALDVIVATCEEAQMPDATPMVLYIFRWLLRRLGDVEGRRAPRNKYARCYGARLLVRLLPVVAKEVTAEGWPADVCEHSEAILLRLSSDRAPSVRLAAVPGLAALQTHAAQAALVRLSMVDTTVAIRLAALKGTIGSKLADDSSLARMSVSRSLDAAPAVRRCLYKRLASEKLGAEGPGISNDDFVKLLHHGMDDVNSSVREAAEEMLCGWLRREHGRTSPLLELLVVIDVGKNTKLAEKVIQCLALKTEWRDMLSTVSKEPPADHDLFRAERALIWRTMVMLPEEGAAQYIKEVGLDPIVRQVERSLERQHSFELRQLLLVLARAGSHAHRDFCCNSCGGCKVFELAVWVLLRSPVQVVVVQERPTASCLALVLIQNALKSCSRVSTPTVRSAHIDARFLDVVNSVLLCLRAPRPDARTIATKYTAVSNESDESAVSTSTYEKQDVCGFDALGERYDDLSRRSQSEEAEGDLIDDFVQTSEILSVLTLRALGISEEAHGLLSTGHVDDSLLQLEDLPSIWFRPTLVRADACEAILGSECASWPVLRAVAVRCLALHTSVCPELSANHWGFFLLVLKRYAPMVISFRNESNLDGPTSSIVESCVHFLVDAQLVHRHVLLASDLDLRAIELFEAVAGLLGLPARQMQLPPKFRSCLTERLCSLLLFGGIWSSDPCNVGDSHRGSSTAMVPAGDLDTIPQAARWVLTGLLVEAFYRPPPAAVAMDNAELASKEASEAAAQRGCLLQFFSSLSDISGMHATLLAAACEGLLASELWRLAVPAQLGSGRRWCALQLPRLLRLLSRHLVMAAGQQGTECMIVKVWLECVWRPLALLCLEAHQDAPTRQLLAEALLATVAAIEVASESRSRFATASEWPLATAEVAYVLSMIVASWGWHKRAGAVRCSEEGDTIRAPPAAAEAPLVKLAIRFSTTHAEDRLEAAEKWEATQTLTRKRRDDLRNAFANLGVETQSIIKAATEAIRIRPSRAFLSGKRPRRRRSSAAASAPRQPRRVSFKGGKRRPRKVVVSDDDSDAPSGPGRDDAIASTSSAKRSRKPSVGGC